MSQVKIVFFASLKESLGQSEAFIDLQGPTSIEEIKQKLNAILDKPDPLFEEGIQCSIDYEFARDSSKVDPNTVKEIAFFPPVTGG
ncbi:MoaD/ThiS family protein [Marinomonas sp. 2405UD68-3]|uniref:MoaD/ThiS family protein n=1 Tax=Marinomonas sp. 2405UD68-3 TaxID=3391835 RepID=UPI0039C8D6B1